MRQRLASPINFVSSFDVFQPTSRCPATFSSATANTYSRLRDSRPAPFVDTMSSLTRAKTCRIAPR